MDTETKKILQCKQCNGNGYITNHFPSGSYHDYCSFCDGTGYSNQAILAYRRALRFAIREYEVPTVDLELTRTKNIRKKVSLPTYSAQAKYMR